MKKPLPIYILVHTPGATEQTGLPVVSWVAVCREQHINISHSPYRDRSRWTHAERKRPFIVSLWRPAPRASTYELNASSTLERAIRAAKRYNKELSCP